MPYFDVVGHGRDSGRKRHERYRAENEAEARQMADDKGTVVESITLVPEPPATDRQKKYATDLKISFPDDISSEAISLLIDEALGKTDHLPPTAEQIKRVAALQLDTAGCRTTMDYDVLLGRYHTIEIWAWSVCRHVAKAPWVLFDDVPILVKSNTHSIAIEIMSDEKLREYILDQDHGLCPNEFYDLQEERSVEEASDWYFFGGEDGLGTNSKAYKIAADWVAGKFNFVRE